MRVFSWDVGIINLAYCLIDFERDDKWEIIDWGIINLTAFSTCGSSFFNLIKLPFFLFSIWKVLCESGTIIKPASNSETFKKL